MSRPKSRMADNVEWVIRTDHADAPKFYGGPLQAWRSKGTEVMLGGVYESGKGLPLDSIVMTPTGKQRIADLRIGDAVLSWDGYPTPVTGVYPQGVRDVYRVTFADGRSVVTDGDHQWFVGRRLKDRVSSAENPSRPAVRGSGYDGYRTFTTAELFEKNLTKKVGSKKETRRRYWIPVCLPAQFERRSLAVDPYLLGILLSEGSLTNAGVQVVNYTSGDFGVAIEIERRTRLRVHKRKGNYAWVIYADGFSWKDVLGELSGKNSESKYIPTDYLYSNVDDRLALLRGLMDGDGTVDKRGSLEYTSVSRQLAEDVRFLVESLGGVVWNIHEKPCSYRKEGERIYTGKTGYTVAFALPPEIVPVTLPRKIARLKIVARPRRFFDSIEYVGQQETVCISVAHPSHLYLTDHFIVTHNTFAALYKMHNLALKYPGCRILLARKLYSSLVSTALVTYYRKVLPYPPEHPLCPIVVFGGSRPETISYPNGSVMVVAGLDNADKVLSAEYDFVYVNQAEELTLHDWEQILSRTTGRAGNAPYSQVFGDANPGPPTHWILHRPSLELYTATHQDNPMLYDHEKEEWTDQGRRTISILSTMTGLRYKRGFLGLWAGAEGQIYETFDEQTHIVDPFPIPDSWRRWRVIDFGYTHPFSCFDDKTEVLSENGWVSFDDLGAGVRVATVRDGTGEMEYQMPVAYLKQKYSGPMVKSNSGRLGADFCVTPNHKMVVESRKTGKVKKVDAAELFSLGSNWSIPVGWQPSYGDSDSDPGPELAKLIGLFVAEGYLNHTSHSVRIAQKDHVSAVRDVLVKAGFPFSEYVAKDGVVQFSIGKRKVYDYLPGLLGSHKSSKKRLPRDCFRWSVASRLALLAGLILGDGRKNCYDEENHIQNSVTYFTNSSRLANDVQELGATLGMATKIGKQFGLSPFTGRPAVIYEVRFNQYDAANVGKLNLSIVPYDGYVYCVEVPNGTLVVRRNNRPMVCGNCQWWAQDHKGTLYMYRELYMSGRIVDEHVNGVNGQPGILQLSAGERYEATICDHDAEDRATLEKYGIKTKKADKSIRQGIEAVQMRLRVDADGNSGLYFFRDALVEEDEMLRIRYKPLSVVGEFGGYAWPSFDARRREASPKDEVPIRADDHGLDCLRYIVMEVDGRKKLGQAKVIAYA